MVDLNGDGQPDVITGKRHMAHNGSDRGERQPLGHYWYECLPGRRAPSNVVKHIVSYGR